MSRKKFLVKYSKPSSRLLQIRRVQKALVLQNRYNEAKKIKKRADQIEGLETKCAEQQIIQAIHRLKERLSIKHQKEIDAFLGHQNNNECYLLNERRKRLLSAELLSKRLEDTVERLKFLKMQNPEDPKTLPTARTARTSRSNQSKPDKIDEKELHGLIIPQYFKEDYPRPCTLR